ncbi:hypothetical protein P4H61_06485 [Paenibacillus peoriae]|uniref:hypothetical protein n=1 Tax=Paenibacillus peoriae TaxID=59893 RepID=UPI00026C5754|nr:hypothetical protein [Paenibacillus peoriae]MEC0181144.1 hypothetical protein [Paenibacillus peoriae]
MSKYVLNKVGAVADLEVDIEEAIDRTIDEKRLVGAGLRVALSEAQYHSCAAGCPDREQKSGGTSQ